MEKVRQTADLEPDVRDQFVDSLQSALARRRCGRTKSSNIRQQQLESRAIASERLLAASKIERTQMTVKELFERFNSLLAERNFAAADEVAEESGQRDAQESDRRRGDGRKRTMVGNYENFMAVAYRAAEGRSWTPSSASRSRTSPSPTISRSSIRTPSGGSR